MTKVLIGVLGLLGATAAFADNLPTTVNVINAMEVVNYTGAGTNGSIAHGGSFTFTGPTTVQFVLPAQQGKAAVNVCALTINAGTPGKPNHEGRPGRVTIQNQAPQFYKCQLLQTPNHFARAMMIKSISSQN